METISFRTIVSTIRRHRPSFSVRSIVQVSGVSRGHSEAVVGLLPDPSASARAFAAAVPPLVAPAAPPVMPLESLPDPLPPPAAGVEAAFAFPASLPVPPFLSTAPFFSVEADLASLAPLGLPAEKTAASSSLTWNLRMQARSGPQGKPMPRRSFGMSSPIRSSASTHQARAAAVRRRRASAERGARRIMVDPADPSGRVGVVPTPSWAASISFRSRSTCSRALVSMINSVMLKSEAMRRSHGSSLGSRWR
ncbi:hypothetical protein BC828DRAFT_375577 [Blastocladiella britannica]|nr:hypothetical protein BC828DRAFT_375577 [Blastocladiella britannica]